jgi:tetratricopeptide (TPR) repeat protein
VPATVDGRSDLFALGRLLYEMLSGAPPGDAEPKRLARRLRHTNPRVSAALADAIAKCLEHDPARRYPNAASLAADLRRHLADLPLTGVADRSVVQRWRRWSRRHPGIAARTGVWAAAVALLLVVVSYAGMEIRRRHAEAEAALAEGTVGVAAERYVEAIHLLRRGLRLASDLPGTETLRSGLRAALRRATRARAAQALHEVADQARLLATADDVGAGAIDALGRQCRSVWASRVAIVGTNETAALPMAAERRLRADLRDVGILWAHLSVRLVPAEERATARREALRILDEAEAVSGPSTALERARQGFAEQLGWSDAARVAARRAGARPPHTAQEFRALGQALYQAGQIEPALEALDAAVGRDPRDYWAHYYAGQCAHKLGRDADALRAFCVCIALAPDLAVCYVHRAVALEYLGRDADALSDLSHALALDPHSSFATMHRGLIRARLGLRKEAAEDLRLALVLGANPETVRLQLARLDRDRRGRSPE